MRLVIRLALLSIGMISLAWIILIESERMDDIQKRLEALELRPHILNDTETWQCGPSNCSAVVSDNSSWVVRYGPQGTASIYENGVLIKTLNRNEHMSNPNTTLCSFTLHTAGECNAYFVNHNSTAKTFSCEKYGKIEIIHDNFTGKNLVRCDK